MKTTKLYSVRRHIGTRSERVGFKGTLLPRIEALAIVRFLKARKVEAFCIPVAVSRG